MFSCFFAEHSLHQCDRRIGTRTGYNLGDDWSFLTAKTRVAVAVSPSHKGFLKIEEHYHLGKQAYQQNSLHFHEVDFPLPYSIAGGYLRRCHDDDDDDDDDDD